MQEVYHIHIVQYSSTPSSVRTSFISVTCIWSSYPEWQVFSLLILKVRLDGRILTKRLKNGIEKAMARNGKVHEENCRMIRIKTTTAGNYKTGRTTKWTTRGRRRNRKKEEEEQEEEKKREEERAHVEGNLLTGCFLIDHWGVCVLSGRARWRVLGKGLVGGSSGGGWRVLSGKE